MSDAFAGAEGARRTNNTVLIGVISEVDFETRRARVEIEDDWITDFLPWLERRAGSVRTWSPPTVGEQVVILSPGGEPAAGIILPGVPSDAFPAAGDRDTLERVELDVGFSDELDCDTNTRTIDIPSGGKLLITFGGETAIEATEEKISLKVGEAEVRISGGKIILFGDVGLGGEGGKAVARVDDPISTQLNKIVAGSGKVTAA